MKDTWILLCSGMSAKDNQTQVVELLESGTFKGRRIGVNLAPILFKPVDYWLTLDHGVWYHYLSTYHKDEKLITWYTASNEFPIPLYKVLHKDDGYLSDNSGIEAIRWLVKTGVKRVVTNGLDLGGKGNLRPHWGHYDGFCDKEVSTPYIDQVRGQLKELSKHIEITSLDADNELGLRSITIKELHLHGI